MDVCGKLPKFPSVCVAVRPHARNNGPCTCTELNDICVSKKGITWTFIGSEGDDNDFISKTIALYRTV